MTRPEFSMSLMDHLQELRKRLLVCVLASVALGIVSLIFARPIFGILMRPILLALPSDARTLIYTSGIEEINVLMKVGLYGGIFLSTPVILWQLWGFISPGLYATEKRYATPFVAMGSIAFLLGLMFCYFALLPQMFQFLLRDPDVAEFEKSLQLARVHQLEAVRLISIGELDQAGSMAKTARVDLSNQMGSVHRGIALDRNIEVNAEWEGLGRLIDAVGVAMGPSVRPVLRKVMETRHQALESITQSHPAEAVRRIDEASKALAGALPAKAAELSEVWKLEQAVASGQMTQTSQNWTRPMLSMNEQLSLVLILELAMGIIFELPLVMGLLAALGVLKSKFLIKYQRHAFVVCLIVAAIVTPTGDAINLSLMTGPMFLCFELGVLAVWLIEKKRAKVDLETTDPAIPK